MDFAILSPPIISDWDFFTIFHWCLINRRIILKIARATWLKKKKKSPFGHIYGVAIANTATTLHAFSHLLGRGSVLSFGTLHCSTLLSSTVLTYWSFSSNKWLYPQGCWIIYLWIPHTYHGARYVVCIQWMFKWLKKWIQRFRNLKNRSELKEIRWMR